MMRDFSIDIGPVLVTAMMQLQVKPVNWPPGKSGALVIQIPQKLKNQKDTGMTAQILAVGFTVKGKWMIMRRDPAL